MEILSDIFGEFIDGEKYSLLKERLLDCVTTDEAVRLIEEAGIADKVFKEMATRIKLNMEEFGENRIQVETIVFNGEYSELISSENAAYFIANI